MRKLIICLIFVLLLSSCFFEQDIDNKNNNTNIENNQTQYSLLTVPADSYKSIRDFCISEEASKIAINTKSSESQVASCEICALYEDIVTFKLSYCDKSPEFYTYKVLFENDYSLELLSSRTFEKFEKNCDFFPTPEDGYPEHAFLPIDPYKIIPSDILSAQKIEYCISEIGSGHTFTDSKHLEQFFFAIDNIEVYPIERFLTNNEKYLGIPLSSTTIEFYTNKEDGEPFCKIFLDIIQIEANERSCIYFANDTSTIYKVYSNILSQKTQP